MLRERACPCTRLGTELVASTCIIACLLNVSLMWIEFGLASSRLASLSSNLRLTRHYLLGAAPPPLSHT